MLAEKSK